MKAVGYIRVSTEEQAREGVSLAHQEQKIRDYCRLHDIELMEIFKDEGISAKTIQGRAAATKAINAVMKGQASELIVCKLDRMFRDAKDALTISDLFNKKGAALHSVSERLDTQGAMGRFFFTMMAAVAEMERNLIAERTSDALQHLKKNGQVYNHVPFGFTAVEGELLQDYAEQEVIYTMKKLERDGMNFTQIAAHLNYFEIPAKKGGQWYAQTVKNVLNFKTEGVIQA